MSFTEKASRDYKFVGDHAMYVISKNAATDIIEHYSQEYRINGIVFRLPPVYGYGPHSEIYVNGKYYKSGFQIFVEKAINSEDIEIWGDSHQSRFGAYCNRRSNNVRSRNPIEGYRKEKKDEFRWEENN